MVVYKYFDALDGTSFQDVWSWDACVFRNSQRKVERLVQQETEIDGVENIFGHIF